MMYIIHVHNEIYIRRWSTWKAIISYQVCITNIFCFKWSSSPDTMDCSTLEGEAVSLFRNVAK